MNPFVEILINVAVGALLTFIFFVVPALYVYVFIKYRKEIKEEAEKKMKERHPNYPKVRRNHFASFPLSLWND
jgi:Na+/H+ antiporter NhaD/arsenite permease-like protein